MHAILPCLQEQLGLLQELHQMRYFDVFELNAAEAHWACFMCNHPEKLSELLNDGYPEIAVSYSYGIIIINNIGSSVASIVFRR